MSTVTAPTAGTDLTPTLQGAVALIRSDGGSAAVLSSLHTEGVSNLVDRPFPAVPEPVVLTDKFTEALLALPEVLGKVQPTVRRELEPDEIATLYKERKALGEVMSYLTSRQDHISATVRAHLDVQAEAKAGPDGALLPRTERGNYLLASKGHPARVNVPDSDEAFSDEFKKGSSTVDETRLLDLYDAGEIDRATYLAFTSERRVFDFKKASEAIKKDPTKISVLARITRRAADSTALYIRKQK